MIFPCAGWGFWGHAECGVSCQALVPELKLTSRVILIAAMQQKAIR